jgi:hypothetical protein
VAAIVQIAADVVGNKVANGPAQSCVKSCPVGQDRAMSQHHDYTPFYNKSAKSESADPDDGAIFTGERKPA